MPHKTRFKCFAHFVHFTSHHQSHPHSTGVGCTWRHVYCCGGKRFAQSRHAIRNGKETIFSHICMYMRSSASAWLCPIMYQIIERDRKRVSTPLHADYPPVSDSDDENHALRRCACTRCAWISARGVRVGWCVKTKSTRPKTRCKRWKQLTHVLRMLLNGMSMVKSF